MAKIPPFFLQAIKEVPDRSFEKVLRTLKITEKGAFKKFVASNATSHTIYRDFVLSLFNCEKAVVASLYASIEGVLFVGGCAPGIGIAFNLVDACFCFILGNWFGCFVAIISCFPIPGFKIVGKGLEKFIVAVLRRISPKQLISLISKLGNRLMQIGFHNDKSYMIIRKQIETLIPELHNPFVETVFRELSKVIQRFPQSSKKVSTTVNKTGEEIAKQYTVQPKSLLSITQRQVTNYQIGKYGTQTMPFIK